ncbi:MAG TPA: hypothetical protein VMJ66_03105 [Geobacteraceae bacterium]|nr:hypothetical protein [Geobacteraceae bacterium]
MKRLLLLVLTCFSLLALTSPLYAWNTAFFASGKVESVSYPDKLVIGKRTYTLAPKSEIVIRYKKGPSIYEKKAYFSDINRGDKVFVRVEGTTIHQVFIERW